MEAGADLVFVQSTVTTARHMSNSYRGLVFSELMENLKVPVVVGNCVSYNVALELMQTGVDGVLVGVWSRSGLHYPGGHRALESRKVSATLECAAARGRPISSRPAAMWRSSPTGVSALEATSASPSPAAPTG